MTRILVREKISPAGLEMLRAEHEVDEGLDMSRDELLERIGEYDALIIRSGTKVDEEVIRRADKLRIIGRAGIGLDNVDIEAATKKGILVANVPQSNIISAAEHTMAVLLALCRKIPPACNSLRSGEWARSRYQGVELYGKTLGIVGLGRIGALVAQRAEGFGMKLIAYDPYVSSQRAHHLGVELAGNLEDMLRAADFITLHVPKSKETYHLISGPEFEMMKDGVMLVNVSRGGIVDEGALIEAVESGKVAGAALDVFEEEPPQESSLLCMEEIVVTPHLGASTKEAQDKAGVAIAEQVIGALKGEFVSGAVNITVPHMDVIDSLKPYLPLCEKLGRFMTFLVEGRLNELELEFRGDISDEDPALLTVAFLKGFFEKISTESVTYVNAPLLAAERGISVKESKSRSAVDYVNMIMARARGEVGEAGAGGTLVGKNQEMFVGILDFGIEIAPSKNMAIVRYTDRPGMIGKVGSILGRNDINIESLQVGRRKVEGDAAMGLSVDRPIPPAVVDELTGQDGIKEVIFITL